MLSGAVSPCSASMEAPINRSGLMIRRMGLRLSESSPTRTESNGWAARTPASKRMAVPELPISSAVSGASIRPPSPSTSTPSGVSINVAPNWASALRVARVSAASSNPDKRDRPLARLERIRALWLIDLSPGGTNVPRSECRAVLTSSTIVQARSGRDSGLRWRAITALG